MKYLVVVEVPGEPGGWVAHDLKILIQNALVLYRSDKLKGCQVEAVGDITKPVSCGQVILEVTTQKIREMRSMV